jgi:beta-lactamase superfamily II metal-dependent hydrolase
VLGVALALVACVTISVNSQTLRIYHIDVEQGDATLFVSPNGHTMLVDSGKNGHGRRIKAIMDQAGVTQIDVFVDTHYHEDHYGGIDDLIRDYNVPVLEAYDRGDKDFLPKSKYSDPTHIDYMATVGEDAFRLRPEDKVPFDPDVSVTCISSGGVVIGEENRTTGVDENDMSISLLVVYKNFRYFIGGDIEEPTETDIANLDQAKDVDVYHSDHHGSNTSSSLAFMEDLSPRAIIISNGNRQDYQHPRQEILDRYKTLPGPPIVFQTNKYLMGGSKGGNVPDSCIADLQSSDEDGTILLEVNGEGSAYTISYRGTIAHTYQCKGIPAATVVIESLLPNPVGNDELLEEVTIRNSSGSSVCLSGWTLKDRRGATWDLASLGSLAAGESKTIVRNGQKMCLANNGDEIALLDPTSTPRDKFEYSSSSEGVRIATSH